MSLITPQIPRLGAIAVVYHDRRFLLVKRGKAPNAGSWGFPGGHVELGETALAAAQRELWEETGVRAEPLGYLTNVDAIGRDAGGQIAYHYLLAAVICRYQSGRPVAADDAADAAWFTPDEAACLPQAPNVQQVIELVLAGAGAAS